MVQIYMSFNGNCKEVIEFYKEALNGKDITIMRYGDLPKDPESPIDESMKEMILHGEMKIDETTFNFSDYTDKMIIGDNIAIMLRLDSEDKVRNYFRNLKVEGTVNIDLGPTAFSSLYCNVTDKFGITWVILVNTDK